MAMTAKEIVTIPRIMAQLFIFFELPWYGFILIVNCDDWSLGEWGLLFERAYEVMVRNVYGCFSEYGDISIFLQIKFGELREREERVVLISCLLHFAGGKRYWRKSSFWFYRRLSRNRCLTMYTTIENIVSEQTSISLASEEGLLIWKVLYNSPLLFVCFSITPEISSPGQMEPSKSRYSVSVRY